VSDDRLVANVRRGDAKAFETLYDRHIRELLSFCRYILGSHSDAEDAVQSTFASAYKALLADERRIDLRPWLFAIARNSCLSIIRQRRAVGEVDEGQASGDDPVAQLEAREDLDQLLSALLELPERQRAALVLAELHGLTQSEIGSLLGVRADQVKSYIYQARSSLISERAARGADCHEIREELTVAHGSSLLRNHLRRHVRSCPGCRAYADQLSRQRRHFGILAPVATSIALKHRTLQAALGKAPAIGSGGVTTGASMTTGAAAELVGGGVKTVTAKLLGGIACVGGTGASVSTVLVGGTLLLGVAVTHTERASPTPSPATRSTHMRPATFVKGDTGVALRAASFSSDGRAQSSRGPEEVGSDRAPLSMVIDAHRADVQSHGNNGVAHASNDATRGRSAASHGNSGAAHGNSSVAHGNNGGAHGNSGANHGRSTASHGNGIAAHGNSALAHSNGAGHRGTPSRGNSSAAHSSTGAGHGPNITSHGNSSAAHGNGGVGHEPDTSSHGNSAAATRGASATGTESPAEAQHSAPQSEHGPPDAAITSKGGAGNGSTQGHSEHPDPSAVHEGGGSPKH
jgi:RNA polymerase sigma factor (sigma-70 family)